MTQTVSRAPGQSPPRTRTRPRFFVISSGLLLAAVLVGFAPTFYLRAFFDAPPLPGYVYLHGILLTAWYVLFVVQTFLVASHRTAVHRRLGVLGVTVAVLMIPVNATVIVRAVPRFLASGMGEERIAGIVAGDFTALLLFSGLVASSVRLRHRPEAHKRLMLLASLAFTGPVLSRLVGLGLPDAAAPPVFVGCLLLLALYDVVSTRRLHEATVWGGIAVLGGVTLSVGVAERAGSAVVAAVMPPKVVGTIHPVFPVSDVKSSVQWYRDVLGFSVFALDESPEPGFAIVTRDTVQIFLQRSGSRDAITRSLNEPARVGWPSRRLDAYLRVPDARAVHELVRRRLPDVESIARTSYGCDEFAIHDPDDHVIVISRCSF